jgi:hypothetical protein
MADLALPRRTGRRRRYSFGRWLLTLLATLVALMLAALPIVYMLWPQPAPVEVDAPTLPVTVAGVAFNVPPGAIRVRLERRPGAQSRLDLAFIWPSLEAPDPTIKPSRAAPPSLADRVFVTITGNDGAMPPVERLKIVYPRYTAASEIVGQDGLVVREFRKDTPYRGEDLIYDPASPEHFLLRCTHALGTTPGMCLHERRIGNADVMVRFPRDWLSDWRTTSAGIDRLIERLRGP